MNDTQLGAAIRLLRYRRGLRQADVAQRAGMSRSIVSMVERGKASELSVTMVRRVAGVLALPLGWDLGWKRADLDRLRDARHAALQNEFKRLLERHGWEVRAEVSFNRYGERGRIDLLARQPLAHVLLVVEIKSSIVDVQDLLGALDVKERVARAMAREMGWVAAPAVPGVVIAEGSTARRRVAAHGALFARFALRGQGALAWLRKPTGRPDGLLIFTGLSDSNGVAASRAGRQRVRLRRATLSTAPHRRGPLEPPEPG